MPIKAEINNNMEKGYTIPVLDHGYVRYIDHMGSDQRILEAARISYKSPSKGDEQDKKLINYLWKNKHCYHPEMQVLTIEGWKKWAECSEYEDYLIPDPTTKTLRIEKLKLLVFDVENETMEGFKNSRMSYLVTPNHKMWFRTKQNFRLKNDKFELREAIDIDNWGHFECGVQYSLNSNLEANSDKFKLIGFYLGDGFLNSSNTICFRLVKDRKIQYLECLLNNLNIPFKKEKRGLTSVGNQIYQFYISRVYFDFADKYIDLSLKACNKNFNTKELNNLSSNEKFSLLDGLINSDGSIKKDREQIEFCSTSYYLAKLFETLSSYFNYDAHFCKKFNNAYQVKSFNLKSRTSLEARKQYFFQKSYTGKVYCTTSSTGLLLVRGNEDEFSFICGNSSPFEMAKLTLNIKMPIFIMRQYVRHRMQNLNEVSARYTELPNEFYIPKNWRKQDNKNKQGSIDDGEFNPHIHYLGFSGICNASQALESHCEDSYKLYEQLLKQGVSREMARMVLPVNIYTEIYCCWDLKNLLHFISLRSDSHAQSEIQEYSNAIGDIVKKLFPWTWDAYSKYKFILKES